MTDSEHEPAQDTDPVSAPVEKKKTRDPVRLVTLGVLCLCFVFFLLYVRADRVMPYSNQGRVSGDVIAVVPQVSGYVIDIDVGLHEVVDAGSVLLRPDWFFYLW